MGRYVGRQPEAAAAVPADTLASAGSLLDSCPALLDYMTSTTWEGGKKRTTSTVTLFVEGGRVKASLNDRALSQGIYATGGGVEEVLRMLEEMLVSNKAEWRPWAKRK